MITTLETVIKQLKIENPTILDGNDATGYSQLDENQYEEKIAYWAQNILAEQEAKAQAAAKKAAAEAKLAALGLTTDDLKALGLN